MEKYYSPEIIKILDKIAKVLITDDKIVLEIEKNKEGRVFIKTQSTAIMNL